MINYEIDGDGIATITWDMPGRSMNVLGPESTPAYIEAVEKAIADDAVKGVIVTSGKSSFIAGADLEMIEKMIASGGGADEAEALLGGLQPAIRRIETSGKPFAAAINGTALGGGLEVCLGCHYRVAADNPRSQIGLPEVKVGLLPGGGGTQRLPRLIGFEKALPLLLEGTPVNPQTALKLGIVDEVVPADQMLAACKKWLLETGNAVQPWDVKGASIPGGGIQTPKGYEIIPAANAMVHARTGDNYPAPLAILSCVYEGLQVPIDTGLLIEWKYFKSLLNDPVAGNIIRTSFINLGKANKLERRPADVPKTEVKKLGVLGAGMMGAGIAFVSAEAGMEVVLLDSSLESAERGKAYSEKVLGKRRVPEDAQGKVLDLIKPTTDFADLEGCDLIIEAVFEDMAVKADVTKKTEAVIPESSTFATNTSSLPITGLAEASQRPDQFIGIHFFSPVDRMALVEIICGEKTGDKALATALDYVQKIRKTPIVVNDSRGFYTSRVFTTYVNEGICMLAEGIDPVVIDNVGKATGMPVGPLALADEVSLELMHHVKGQAMASGDTASLENPANAVLDLFVEKLDRIGRKSGKGFYDYPEGAGKHLWPGLAEQFPPSGDADIDEMKKRFLYIQSIETARCMEENVVTAPQDADIGALLGWGFAGWTGGPISLIDTVGAAGFVDECDRMAQQYGARFSPPKSLRDKAAGNAKYYSAA